MTLDATSYQSLQWGCCLPAVRENLEPVNDSTLNGLEWPRMGEQLRRSLQRLTVFTTSLEESGLQAVDISQLYGILQHSMSSR